MPAGLPAGFPVSLVGRPLVLRPPLVQPLPPYLLSTLNGWHPGGAISVAERPTVFDQLTTTDLVALLPPDVS